MVTEGERVGEEIGGRVGEEVGAKVGSRVMVVKLGLEEGEEEGDTVVVPVSSAVTISSGPAAITSSTGTVITEPITMTALSWRPGALHTARFWQPKKVTSKAYVSVMEC